MRVQKQPLNLAAFLALAQHEVQKVIEYAAQPEVRQQGPEAPSQVFAQLGTVRMTIPVRFGVAAERGRASRSTKGAPPTVCCDATTGDPREVLQPGMPWPPEGRTQMRYHLHVSTVGGCAEEGGCGPVGKIEIEFVTCLKQ